MPFSALPLMHWQLFMQCVFNRPTVVGVLDRGGLWHDLENRQYDPHGVAERTLFIMVESLP
jgi:hypothetical protein